MNHQANLFTISQSLKYYSLQSLLTRVDNQSVVSNHNKKSATNYQTITQQVETFQKEWNSLIHGSSQDEFFSLLGFSHSMDRILTGTSSNNGASNQTNATASATLPLTTLARNLLSSTLKLNTLLLNSSNVYIPSNMDLNEYYYNNIYMSSNQFMDSLLQLMQNTFEEFTVTGQRDFIIVASLLSIPILALLMYLIYHYTRSISHENHQMRLQLNHLPWEILDSTLDIHNFIFHGTLVKYDFERQLRTKKVKNTKEKAILEACITGAVICSSFGVVEIFNTSALKMFDYRSEQVIGSPLEKLFDKNSYGVLIPILTKMGSSLNSYGENVELVGMRKNGSTFPVELRISVSNLEGRNIISCFLKDLTSDKEQVKQLDEEKKKSESLLLTIMPEHVARRLKLGEQFIADKFDDVTCLFSDLVGFKEASLSMSAIEIVGTLNDIINKFDEVCIKYHLEKIKTISEKYFCSGGLKENEKSFDLPHTERCLLFAIDLFGVMHAFNEYSEKKLNIRIGINNGPVAAGVIGVVKFAYDLWGDNVNIASRMESTCPPSRIQVTQGVKERLQDKFIFEERGYVQIKGKGAMKTFLLSDRYHLNPVE
ncbi:hypothetical protein C9374_002008 [Naegleria lovaniensis]|uniref:Guanylate cyclase domain-containing protein n=1 Tax=Naegleria lovaniensis TaxID=51637 RepID=A0AA88GVA6_NAELO|nr:uncharacterized protein C9374_002008 [Naegleria lovaniensis]KAG2386973.1 hypothetical protein C9374_002008 [Naegleria lovaniensis]